MSAAAGGGSKTNTGISREWDQWVYWWNHGEQRAGYHGKRVRFDKQQRKRSCLGPEWQDE